MTKGKSKQSPSSLEDILEAHRKNGTKIVATIHEDGRVSLHIDHLRVKSPFYFPEDEGGTISMVDAKHWLKGLLS